MIHWIQNARSGKFADFNGNSYRPGGLTVPTAVFYGNYDYLGDPVDVGQLLLQLRASNRLVDSQAYEYAHMDFVWAYDAATSLYPRILNLLRSYNP